MVRKLTDVPFRALRFCLRLVEPSALRLASRYRLAASLYYFVFNQSFSFEQRAFIAGRLAYHKSLVSPEGTIALLRRNIHRIEKGLIMRPRRVPFALDYIKQTVDAYGLAMTSGSVDSRECAWAQDVLEHYFDACAKCSELKSHYEAFKANTPPCKSETIRLIPYKRDLTNHPKCDYDALLDLAIRRRSVRWFLPRIIPRNLIDRALELGCLAPSACNRQPFEFRIFDDPDLVRKVIEIPFGLAGYGHNVPCIAVVIGKQRNFFDERDRHLIYIDSSLAIMGFLFGLECQGLSSCCVNWPEIASNDEKMARLIGLSADERPIMLVAIGYPDPEGMVARSTKKSISTLRRYNFECKNHSQSKSTEPELTTEAQS